VTTTRTKRATALPPDERRSMIVAATLPLLLEHGERVTSRQIAEAAGIAEGTIFRAFADKDEVIAAVIEAALDPAPLEAALRAIPGDLGFEATLEAAIVILQQQRVIDLWRLVSSVGTRFHEMTRRPMADSDALVGIFEAHRTRTTVEPIVAARVLRALTLSTTHPMLADEPWAPSELMRLFLHGVGDAPSC
jgi:AcrR family transcriptional regulator